MKHPKCGRIPQTTYRFRGHLADYLTGVTEQWLKAAPLANPGMLEIFRDRDRQPLRDLVPWAGEFAGKYLTSAVQILRLTQDANLKTFIRNFVNQLVQLQDADGYLGPWSQENRLTGEAPNVGGKAGNTWDAWGHYHIMLGLILWHEESGDKAVSIYRGPILLTYDRHLNEMDPDEIPALDATAMKERLISNKDNLPTVVLVEYTASDGRKLRLCDFGSAGKGGSPYCSWLPVEQIGVTRFVADDPNSNYMLAQTS